MKKIRKIAAILLVTVCMMSVTAEAKSIPENLTHENVSEAVEYNYQRGNILNQGTARISDNEDGTVNIFGAVYGSVVCDKLTLKLTLQKYSGGTWTNCGTYSQTAYDKASLAKSYNVSVSGGYYYRVKAACTAEKDGTTESKMPVTNGIWID